MGCMLEFSLEPACLHSLHVIFPLLSGFHNFII
jgi:hypothetical protein